MLYTLKREHFDYPVCIDSNDSINLLNHFPSDMTFQTFLLDKDNKVLAIGNPVLNPNVKALYLNIISGKTPYASDGDHKQQPTTTVSLSSTEEDLGQFPWKMKATCEFTLTNRGKVPLVIHDVNTSCGCTTVEYPKEPVRPGGTAVLKVTYQADHPEHFNKTLTVYCNAENAPLKLRITGESVDKVTRRQGDKLTR